MEPKPKRPLLVTLLAVVVFSLSAAGFASLVAGLARWQTFTGLSLSLPLWLLIAFGGMWGVIWLVVAWGLWRLLPWAWHTTIACWIVYQVMIIGQQVLFARGDYERDRLPFAIGVTILLTVLLIAGLTLPRVRQAFGKSNDQRPTSNEQHPNF
jgi:hypothetical protein